MEILEKIKELKDERGWSVYRLADEASLKQSTVANMFARNTNPSIATLQQLCNAFGITLAEFFAMDENKNTDEIKLLSNYRKLSKTNKNIVIGLIEILNRNN